MGERIGGRQPEREREDEHPEGEEDDRHGQGTAFQDPRQDSGQQGAHAQQGEKEVGQLHPGELPRWRGKHACGSGLSAPPPGMRAK